ncbi:MAG TPA: hypothetical protein VHN77_01935 [Phycisphaerales bacterium]|nr:hypothetical protein [Phycisphaerales bacterium]
MALVAAGVCGLSYIVEWSSFTATPVRPKASTGTAFTASTPAGTMLEERDETHIMFGHGGVYRYTMKSVYTLSFAAPHADRNSKALAWATLDNIISRWWGRPVFWQTGYVYGGRLWFPVVCFGAMSIACLGLRTWIVPDGQCRRCRYDMGGCPPNAQGVTLCPECGRPA